MAKTGSSTAPTSWIPLLQVLMAPTHSQALSVELQLHPSNLFTWHLQQGSTKVDFVLLKNIQEKVILYWCWNYFPTLENITVFKLRLSSQDSCHWVDVRSYNSIHFIFTLFLFDFDTKIFHYQSIPTITLHGTENVLPMKFEILRLARSNIVLFRWTLASCILPGKPDAKSRKHFLPSTR